MLLKKNIPLTYVFGKIKWEILLVLLYSIVIVVLYNNLHITRISIPLSVPMILATVLSLLLAFKSNQAYDRWWEARTIWGAIVNDSRTLARQMLTLSAAAEISPAQEAFREKFIRRHMGWPHSLGQSLRDKDPAKGLHKFLDPSEIEYIARYDNKPMAILELHARDLNYALQNKWINRYQQIEIDATITRLCNGMGQCERIKKTVFPSTYSLYIRFAMYFFILLLPFGLIEFFGVAEVPLVVAIAASFLLVEKMSVHLQDPFENRETDTPVTTISNTIEKDLKQMLNDRQLTVQKEKTEVRVNYYVM